MRAKRLSAPDSEVFLEVLGGITFDAWERATKPGRSGRVVSCSCELCDTVMVFVEDPEGVEFVGSIGLCPPCDGHAGDGVVEWAYNRRCVRW